MATGIPNISIPLYTLQRGSITVPIVLNYHAGGVKINDMASWVGLGWSLNCSGTINKKTNGLDDFYATSAVGGTPYENYVTPNYTFAPYNSGYTNMTEAINGISTASVISAVDSNYLFFSPVLFGHMDAEADEFYYSMPGGAGKFYFNQVQSTWQTSKIDGTSVEGGVGGFTVVTKDGRIYEFGVNEQTLSQGAQQYVNTAWHLNNITDPSTGQWVNFAYDNYFKHFVMEGSYFRHNYNFTTSPPANFGLSATSNSRTGDNYLLSTISFDNGTIQFIKDTDKRLDSGANALKEIRIYNNRNLLLKKFLFTYFYHFSDSTAGETCCAAAFRQSLRYRLFLSSVQEIEYDESGNSLIKPAFRFSYDTTTFLPQRFSFAQDKWGHSNGKTTNTTSIPSHPAAGTHAILIDANRDVDSNYTKAGMLTGIVYPTGGKTSFEFESNDVSLLTGGLRIRTVTQSDSVANKNMVTEYKYTLPNGSSTGQVFHSPIFHYDLYHITGNFEQGLTTQYIIRTESTPIHPLFPNQGSPVLYTMVEKREKSGDGDLMSRHYFQHHIEEGETWTNLRSVPHPKHLEINDISEHATELYKRNSDGNYVLSQSTASTYETLRSTQKAIWNAQGAWTYLGMEFSEWPGGDPTIVSPISQWFPPSIHAYKVMPSTNVKSGQLVTTIANNDTLTLYSKFEYDSTNGNLKAAYSVDSYGDTTIVRTKYSSDYISASSPAINSEIKALRDQNMIGSPIEIITLLKKKDSVNAWVQGAVLFEYDGLKIKKIYKVYDEVSFNSFTVSSNDVSGFYKDSRYEIFQEVTAWDNQGRPRTVISNTNAVSYIWDEKYEQPTAVIQNASYADVAYTSFEGQSNGTWTVGSSSRDSTYAITGRRCYTLASGNISKTGFTSGSTYIVSYWNRNGSASSFSVSGSSSVKQGRTSNGWTQYEHEITGVSTVTVSGTGYIDELRIFPKNANLASFCYEELLGMTAQCDAANRISYFEYFGPGKLKLVRDQDRNIIKKICYNFAGQPDDDCNPVYYNATASGNFTRNNCHPNHTGSLVVYSVPANTYSSTISQAYVDALAAADITANGQNYANTNGTCTSNCTTQNCSDEGYKCVNGYCEQGIRVATECIYDDLQGTWTNTYHYEWSDSSWSQNYIIYNADSSWCE